jgi:putative membrane protein
VAETEPLPVNTRLAVDRTRLAYDRTLLAWVRTAASLISFGFSIHKFFQYLHDSNQIEPSTRLLGPREFALLMIGIGVVILALATVDHRIHLKQLRAEYREVPYSFATVVAGLVSILGISGLLAVWFRL